MSSYRSSRVLRLRVKDKHAKWLCGLAREVNMVFNYCNELSVRVFERERRFLSGFDFWPFLKGVTRGDCALHLPVQAVQEIAEGYARRRRQHQKIRLAWRKSDGAHRSRKESSALEGEDDVNSGYPVYFWKQERYGRSTGAELEAVMNIVFTPNEARVIGCLIEKEITTPDQYPLSLNALTNACNQKTNREPVLELSESEVQQSVDSLMKKYMVSDKSAGYGGRVTKYKHRFCNTEFGSLKFSKQELGIICVMLLRGPQTPGELRSRTNRLCEFADAEEVETALRGLMTREDGPFIARLPRAPGARESRYAHLFSGAIESAAEPEAAQAAGAAGEPSAPTLSQRVSALEEIVAQLRAQIDALNRTP